MTRAYIEKIMGIATGSGVDVNIPLKLLRERSGFEGEGIADHRTFIIKSHSPERSHNNTSFNASRVVLLVRNPLDVLVSSFNMVAARFNYST